MTCSNNSSGVVAPTYTTGQLSPAQFATPTDWITFQEQMRAQAHQQVSPQFARPEELLIGMIRSRFHLDVRERLPFAHIYAHRAYDIRTDTANGDVFVVVWPKPGDVPVVLQDGWDLFPSDTLMTQLRLLAG